MNTFKFTILNSDFIMKKHMKKLNKINKNVSECSIKNAFQCKKDDGIIVNGMNEEELSDLMRTPINNEKQLKNVMSLNKWDIVSTNKHIKYQRMVVLKGAKSPIKQTYIRSVSASGDKEYVYILRNIRQQNSNLSYIV